MVAVPVDLSMGTPSAYEAPGADSPAVASGPRSGARLVVWTDSDGLTTSVDDRVSARLIDATGGPLGPVRTISGIAPAGAQVGRASVVYDPTSNRYLVAWRTLGDDLHTTRPTQLFIRFVDASGVPVGAGETTIDRPSAPDEELRLGADPAIARDAHTGTYVIAWVAPVAGQPAVLAQRLTAAGQPVGAPELLGAASGYRVVASRPSVVYETGARRFVAAWSTASFSPDMTTVSARTIDDHGRLGSTHTVYRDKGRDADVVGLASDGASAVIAWTGFAYSGETVYARRLGAGARPVVGRRRALAPSSEGVAAPNVSYDTTRRRYSAAWTAYPPGAGGWPHCSGSSRGLRRVVRPDGVPIGSVRDLHVDVPQPTPGLDDNGNPCRPVVVDGLVQSDSLLVWSGQIIGSPRQVWTRPR
jgi:hypothetical protein